MEKIQYSEGRLEVLNGIGASRENGVAVTNDGKYRNFIDSYIETFMVTGVLCSCLGGQIEADSCSLEDEFACVVKQRKRGDAPNFLEARTVKEERQEIHI